MSIRRSSVLARRRALAVLAVVAATVGFTAAASPARAQAAHAGNSAAGNPAAGNPAVGAAAAAVGPHAVPGPPAGFTLTWSDDFTGAAGTGIDGNWKYDTGPGSSFGTGEIE